METQSRPNPGVRIWAGERAEVALASRGGWQEVRGVVKPR